MNRPKSAKASGREVPLEDPRIIRSAVETLLREQTEFPIKVEGASTLPYTSVVKDLDFPKRTFQLKLIRPLPHEMLSGAEFRMIFAVEDQRYEALIHFLQREAYLTYSFRMPSALFYSDRRAHKRFPFRPREKAYVTGQDGGVPGLGVAGAMANIGLGGVALRIDRILKLDDGMRIPPSTAIFDRGKTFVRLRLQELPRIALLEVHGSVAHITERGSEIILGLSFGELSDEDLRLLSASLEFREKMFRAAPAIGHGDPSQAQPRIRGVVKDDMPKSVSETESEAEPSGESLAHEGLDPLILMQRRTAPLALLLPDGGRREEVLAYLKDYGYLRTKLIDHPDQIATVATQADSQSPYCLLLADMNAAMQDVGEPLAAVRLVERQAAELGQIPLVILCNTIDPTMIMAQERLTRFVAVDDGGLESLGPVLDQELTLISGNGC